MEYDIRNLVKLCGVSETTIRKHERRGLIPSPNLVAGWRVAWDEERGKKIVEYFKGRDRWSPVDPRTRLYTYDGRSQSIKAWSEEYGLMEQTLRRRLRAGWMMEKALFTPVFAKDEK